jgi:hypothetical protein
MELMMELYFTIDNAVTNPRMRDHILGHNDDPLDKKIKDNVDRIFSSISPIYEVVVANY